MTQSHTKKIKIPNLITTHIKENLKSYIATTLTFILGTLLGVMYLNHLAPAQKQEITTHLTTYIAQAKDQSKISTPENLKTNIASNVKLAIALWFAGTTIIGIPVVFGIILYRGFCLGYTISACTYTMGLGKGIAFTATALLAQNILLIPAILALGVSGTNLYKTIIKKKSTRLGGTQNIKAQILKHTVFSIIMLALLILSAIIKTNISGDLLEKIIKYF